MSHQEIIYNVTGQSFFFDCPEGIPSSPTATVFLSSNGDDSLAEAATTGSASVDPVNTTLSSPASSGTNSLSLSSATGLVARRHYLLSDATTGNTESVQVIGISGSTVTLRKPLLESYSNGSSFAGTRISIAVDPTWVATKAKISDAFGSEWHTDRERKYFDWQAGYSGYRVRWTYTVNGSPTASVGYADLVRYSAKNLVTPNQVDQRFPGFLDRLPTDYRSDQGKALIEDAYEQVRFDLMGAGQVARRIRNTEILGELTKHMAHVLSLENELSNGGSNALAADMARKKYEGRLDQLAVEPKYQTDQDGTGTGQASNALAVWIR